MYIHLFIYFRHFNIWQSIHKVLGSYMYTLLCCCYHKIPQQKATLKNGFTLAYGSRETESRTAQKTWQQQCEAEITVHLHTESSMREQEAEWRSEALRAHSFRCTSLSKSLLSEGYVSLWNSAIKETEWSNVRVYGEQFLSVHPTVQYFKSWSRNCI